MSVVFETPGELDIRAFTTFGLHAKPNSTNPIGKFGSGLKNAIAMLVREGISVRVFIGKMEYEFYKKSTEFRGEDFDLIRMRKRRTFLPKGWAYQELPYTSAHAKHWQLWQAFRELHSNTLDEGGETWFDVHPEGSPVYPRDNTTFIVVDGEAFTQVFRDKDKIFLPGALTKREGDDRVQIFNEPSDYLYWRGMRVFDLEKPSMYTYNILENLELTEDRTLKFLWDAQSRIAAYVARSKDEKLINAVVTANKEKFFEGRIDFDYAYVSPSDEFKEVIRKKQSRGGYISPAALGYYKRYAPPAPKAESIRDRIMAVAYAPGLPQEILELLQYLLKCNIEEPETVDDDLPF